MGSDHVQSTFDRTITCCSPLPWFMLKASQYFSENTNIKTTAIGETHQPKVCLKDSVCLTGKMKYRNIWNVMSLKLIKGRFWCGFFPYTFWKFIFLHLAITLMKKALVVYHAKDYDHLALQRHELSLSLWIWTLMKPRGTKK